MHNNNNNNFVFNCFCLVNPKALDRRAALLKVDKLVAGHNADDIAETVLLNILRGDIASLQACTLLMHIRGFAREFIKDLERIRLELITENWIQRIAAKEIKQRDELSSARI
ncbi:cytoplasmic tRNA 2-thiolation protein 1-like [Arabidopsis lyrata subsp. lyrata]|uniref:cytoplasmic tRNA 2-thiolation protein 1-like n=1 Tax=Arabidopsis lyrata subsp. lyrata TaxID=81972 RepID=UPI000A29B347|nr:cytoplasmic tRNA 2-thiolation protein 1-like [Arabidopsis lyrata subsp. lyrata]|eukprot:XP_020875556.1 cytoplasmic tRNA 2-thiolation protein 1-like [Arabidopsis lyrata subsp. lyrata]